MRISKIFLVAIAAIMIIANPALAQEAQEAASTAPSAVPNLIGSIIGLILLIAMCYGVARVALKKD